MEPFGTMDLWREPQVFWTPWNFSKKASSGYRYVRAVFTANQFFLRESPDRVNRIALTAAAACLVYGGKQTTLPKYVEDISDDTVRAVREKYREVSTGNSILVGYAPFKPSMMDFDSTVEGGFDDEDIRRIYFAFVLGCLHDNCDMNGIFNRSSFGLWWAWLYERYNGEEQGNRSNISNQE